MAEVGAEFIYRLRDYAASERVRVVEVDRSKKSPRYVVEFLDGEKSGTQENIPGGRLRGPWPEVAAYDARMADWERIDQHSLLDVEESAVEQVFLLLVPEHVATWEWNPVRYAARVVDRDGLRKIIGVSVDDLLAQTEGFVLDDGKVMLSSEGTLMIAEFACRVNPMVVLDWVTEDEVKHRQRSKFGRSGERAEYLPPEIEYELYRTYTRPVHELLRAWCGIRAVTLQERLGAAEAENRRLEELLSRVFGELRRLGHSQAADYLERAYEDERITPANFRPVVERPLKPSEIPVRAVRKPWPYWKF